MNEFLLRGQIRIPVILFLARSLVGLTVALTVACSSPLINVMGRSVPDSEYKAIYDEDIAREKRGLPPSGGHDEHGRVPSWPEYWRTIGGTTAVPPNAQTRRLKRYIIEQRRTAGLPELSGLRAD